MSFAVFMGYFYGRAKLFFDYGDKEKSRTNLWLAYLSAVFPCPRSNINKIISRHHCLFVVFYNYNCIT